MRCPARHQHHHRNTLTKGTIMADAIDNTAGRYSFADSRNDAWHQLGQQVGHEMTPAEALEAAHMNGWNVRKEALIAQVEHPVWGKLDTPVPGKFVVIRDNPHTLKPEALGVVGDRFQPFQNEETTDLLYDITDQSGAHIQTIGALDGGRRTFVTMLMPTHVEFTGQGGFADKTEVYLAVINHHDGEGSLRAIISPIRIVCANTQRLAESMAVSTVALRHTGAPTAKLAEVRNLLGITFKYIDTYATEMEALVKAERDEAWVRAVFNEVFGVNKADSDKMRTGRVERVTQVMEVMRQSPSIKPFAGTAYGAYNAVTEYADHFMPVLGKGDAAAKRAVRTLTSPDVAALKSQAFTSLKKALPLTADQVLRWGPVAGDVKEVATV
jgi:phage/plasmid-like protein (TIGR03299 family)